MFKSETIIKTIANRTSAEKFVGDVLLFELKDLSEVGLDENNCSLFRSGRQKNDMPSVCRFGLFDDAMKDCIGAVSESGDGKESFCSKVIVSDHLTILGNDDNAVVIAFSGGEHHLVRTEIYVNDNGCFGGLKTFAEFNCVLNPDEKRTTEKLEIIFTDDVNDTIKKWAVARTENKKIHDKKCPAVFCTWYYYERTITLKDVRTNLEKIKEKNLPFDVFQIDDGWELFPGEWIANNQFPCSMKYLAEEIKSYGLTPGIWTCPFVADEKSTIWKEHPEWILREKNGSPSIYNVNGIDLYIVDITNSETWKYFEEFYRRLTFEWGYKYHKLDFTRAPIIASNPDFFNKHDTIIECYRNAVGAIKKGMGDEAFFLMCGGLYDPLIGLVDAQRAGSDVLSMWSSTINRNGKTLPYTIKQSLLRYYMNNWWYNDPDALMIRKNEVMERGTRLTYGLLNDDEVKTSVLNQLIGGGLICSTEPLDKIDDDRLSNLKHILPVRGIETEIVDLMSGERFPSMIRLKEKNNDKNAYLVKINWDDNNSIFPKISLKKIVGKNKNFNELSECFVYDFYGRKNYKNLSINDEIIISKIPSHAATILKLSSEDENDVDYSGHYLM